MSFSMIALHKLSHKRHNKSMIEANVDGDLLQRSLTSEKARAATHSPRRNVKVLIQQDTSFAIVIVILVCLPT
jgi:hypothetical protein